MLIVLTYFFKSSLKMLLFLKSSGILSILNFSFWMTSDIFIFYSDYRKQLTFSRKYLYCFFFWVFQASWFWSFCFKRYRFWVINGLDRFNVDVFPFLQTIKIWLTWTVTDQVSDFHVFPYRMKLIFIPCFLTGLVSDEFLNLQILTYDASLVKLCFYLLHWQVGLSA